ncbi:MAG: ATP-binding cassette domain-containing protein [Thermoleophilia bacterium]
MGLGAFARHYPDQLSGGMKQRLALARVLVGTPSILLMDEPLAALDAQARSNMQDLLLRLHSHYRPTIVFVTHDPEKAVLLADRVHLLCGHPSRVVAEIPVEFPRPRDPLSPEFVRTKGRLLAAIKDITPQAASLR